DFQAVAVGRPCAVRHPGRHDRDVALAHDAHIAVQIEGELAVEHDDDLLFLVDVPRRFSAGLEADEIRHRPVALHGPEAEAGEELDWGDGVDVDIPAWAGGLAVRLGGEVALGIAQRTGVAYSPVVVRLLHSGGFGGVVPTGRNSAHRSSRAVLSTSPIRWMPSSISSSATRLYARRICALPSSPG